MLVEIDKHMLYKTCHKIYKTYMSYIIYKTYQPYQAYRSYLLLAQRPQLAYGACEGIEMQV